MSNNDIEIHRSTEGTPGTRSTWTWLSELGRRAQRSEERRSLLPQDGRGAQRSEERRSLLPQDGGTAVCGCDQMINYGMDCLRRLCNRNREAAVSSSENSAPQEGINSQQPHRGTTMHYGTVGDSSGAGPSAEGIAPRQKDKGSEGDRRKDLWAPEISVPQEELMVKDYGTQVWREKDSELDPFLGLQALAGRYTPAIVTATKHDAVYVLLSDTTATETEYDLYANLPTGKAAQEGTKELKKVITKKRGMILDHTLNRLLRDNPHIKVERKDKKGEFVLADLPGFKGLMARDSLGESIKRGDQLDDGKVSSHEVVVVTAIETPVYSNSTGEGSALEDVHLATTFPLLELQGQEGRTEGRVPIVLSRDKVGWVEQESVEIRSCDKPFPRKPSVEIADLARKLEGRPFLYGGDTPRSGLDGSAFTQLCCRANGIDLPRHSNDQYLHTLKHPELFQKVDEFADASQEQGKKRQAGDLIFFVKQIGEEPKAYYSAIALDQHVWTSAEGFYDKKVTQRCIAKCNDSHDNHQPYQPCTAEMYVVMRPIEPESQAE